MKIFAKIYNHQRLGQVVIIAETGDNDEPCISIVCDLEEFGFGVCKARLLYKDSDKGWAKRDEKFFEIDAGKGVGLAEGSFGHIVMKTKPRPTCPTCQKTPVLVDGGWCDGCLE